ncbi:defensin gallicin-like [Mya arenaria]|uniref:defensin gallicin-like n=1 Tax=Mya arenaria TaxID=6604 RepID=UPI0022DF847A|nr:defensin gallicin-like [Mya arenaria]
MKQFLIALSIVIIAVGSEGKDTEEMPFGTSCKFGLCSLSCKANDYADGGCCGTTKWCEDICYCYGSGFEYRCDACY